MVVAIDGKGSFKIQRIRGMSIYQDTVYWSNNDKSTDHIHFIAKCTIQTDNSCTDPEKVASFSTRSLPQGLAVFNAFEIKGKLILKYWITCKTDIIWVLVIYQISKRKSFHKQNSTYLEGL